MPARTILGGLKAGEPQGSSIDYILKPVYCPSPSKLKNVNTTFLVSTSKIVTIHTCIHIEIKLSGAP